MSAGRITWQARSFVFVDPSTGIACVVMATLGAWTWTVSSGVVVVAQGTAKAPGVAKGAARKAMEQAAKAGGEREKKR